MLVYQRVKLRVPQKVTHSDDNLETPRGSGVPMPVVFLDESAFSDEMWPLWPQARGDGDDSDDTWSWGLNKKGYIWWFDPNFFMKK